jgi:proline iminopeptidase
MSMRTPTRGTRSHTFVRQAALPVLIAGILSCASPRPPLAKPAGVEERVIPAGDVRLFVRTVGSGPALVLINGGPGASHHAISRLESLASSSLRVVLYDQRGMGSSTAPAAESAYSLDHYVADVDAVREGLGLAKIHVLGHSFGGLVAMAYAGAHPDRVASMILVSSGPPDSATHRAGNAVFEARYAKLLAEKKIPETLPPVVGDDCREQSNAIVPVLFADPDFKGPLEESKTTQCSVRVQAATGKLFREYDLRPKLKGFKAPTLVVVGAADPFGEAGAKATVQALERAQPQYAILPKCGHFPWVECPEAFRPVVEEFLAKVAAR